MGSKVWGRGSSSWRRQLLCRMGSRGATNWSQSWNMLVETNKQLLRQAAHLLESKEVRDSGPLVARDEVGNTLDRSVQLYECASCTGQTTGRDSRTRYCCTCLSSHH